MIFNVKLVILVLVAALCLQTQVSAQTANEQTQPSLSSLDVSKLIDDAARNSGQADKKMLLEYAWTGTTTIRYFDKKGRLKETEEETAQIYPRLGQQAEIITSRNGKAVSSEEIAKAEKRLAKELIADEEKRQKYAASLDELDYGIGIEVNDNETVVSFKSLFQAANFTNPRRVDLNGRSTILLDFTPRLAANSLEDKVKHLAFLTGQVWIDEAERQPAKLEARLIATALQRATAERDEKEALPTDFDNSSPSVVIEKTRLPDGAWVFKSFRIYTLLAPFAFNNLRVDFTGESRDFKRFVATAEEYKPQPQP